jgi:uncharacterized integral membrane protein
MRFALILSLLLAVLAVVFALQNPGYTDVNVGAWQIHGSTALVLMVTFGLGVLVGILATLPGVIRHRRRVKGLEREKTQLGAQYDANSALGKPYGSSEYDYIPPKKDSAL